MTLLHYLAKVSNISSMLLSCRKSCVMLLLLFGCVEVGYCQVAIINLNSGKALTVPFWNNSNGAHVVQFDWQGATEQQWRVVPLGNGYNRIENVFSGKVLDVAGVSVDNGAVIQQWDWLGGGNQQWRITVLQTSGGYSQLLNLHSQKALDVGYFSQQNNWEIQQWDWFDGDNQKWAVIPIDEMTGWSYHWEPFFPDMPDPDQGGFCTRCSAYCGTTCMDNATCECGISPECVESTESGFALSCIACTPIVLDTTGRGFQFTSMRRGVKFRIRPNGPLEQMSWPEATSQNGWLVLDRNGNGSIYDLTELFGNLSPQPESSEPNGYRALAVFDDLAHGGNGNNRIDPGDSVYQHLRVWIDQNHNGVSEANELRSLQDHGILSVGVQYVHSDYVDQHRNTFRYSAPLVSESGTGPDHSYDVLLVVKPTISR